MAIRRLILVLLTAFGLAPGVNAQERIDWPLTAVLMTNVPIGLVAIQDIYRHRYQADNDIVLSSPHWRPRGPEWGDDARGFDAAGNAFYCYLGVRTLRHAYEAVGFHREHAAMAAGANLFVLHLFAKYKESTFYGTQPHDLAGAWGGMTFALLQSLYPDLERVQFKWFWYDTRPEKGFTYSFLEEYRPQKFFIAVRLGDLLFEHGPLRGFGLSYGGGLTGDWGVRHYMGLDYDLREIVPGLLGEILNYIHLPLPALYYDGKLKVGLAL